jgi:hypothetical protein
MKDHKTPKRDLQMIFLLRRCRAHWWACVALVFMVLLATGGCNDQTLAADLLAQGTTSASLLRAYYESLEQTVLDSWEFEAAYSKLTGVPFEKGEEAPYQARLAALHARTGLARELAAVYTAAAQLRSGSDEQARCAAQQLGQALKTVPKLPTAGIDPAEPLGQAAETLLGFVRTRDLKAANRSLVQVLDGLATLYTQEAPVYNTVTAEREQSGLHLLEVLAGQKMVSLTPLLQDLASRVGAPWNEATSLPTQSIETGLSIARVRARRAEMLAACASDETGGMLRELAARHRELAGGASGSLRTLSDATDRAKGCLQQRAQLFAPRAAKAETK